MAAVFDGGVFDIGVFDVTAAAGSVTLTATVSLIAGVATGNVVQEPEPIPVHFGVGARMRPPLRPRIHAVAPGALMVAHASIIPGTAYAVRWKIERKPRSIELVPGHASGSATIPLLDLAA